MKKHSILFLGMVGCILLSGCSTESNTSGTGENTLEEVFDSYKEELKKTYSPTEQDFLVSGAAFRSSKLYNFCQKMPKGSDLHVHHPTFLPLDMLVDYVKDHPVLKVNTTAGDSLGTIIFCPEGNNVPKGYTALAEALESGLTADDFIKAWSVKGNSGKRVWDWFETLFDKTMNMTPTNDLLEDYLTRSFKYYIQQGVTHMEPRVLFFGTEEQALGQARTFYRAQNAARKVDPAFSVSVIFCGLKAKTDSYDKTQFNEELFRNGVYASMNIKDTIAGGTDFLVGLDLVNEEDMSLPLVQFKPLIDNAVAQNPSLHITLHAGESLKEDNNEIASALALGAERIGHGFNLYRHDAVKQEIMDKGVTLECCPISNHILGYCPDLQQHPAIGFIRDSLKVALSADDPCFLMCRSLVDDYFVAAAVWNLSLPEIKQLCINSIESSFLPESRKSEHRKDWEEKWKQFEKEMITNFQKQ